MNLLKIGYECELHNNPADFMLDVINGDVNPDKSSSANMQIEGIDNSTFISIENETVTIPHGDVTQVTFRESNEHPNGSATGIFCTYCK